MSTGTARVRKMHTIYNYAVYVGTRQLTKVWNIDHMHMHGNFYCEWRESTASLCTTCSACLDLDPVECSQTPCPTPLGKYEEGWKREEGG